MHTPAQPQPSHVHSCCMGTVLGTLGAVLGMQASPSASKSISDLYFPSAAILLSPKSHC